MKNIVSNAIALIVLLNAASVYAQPSTDAYTIEETWRLQLNTTALPDNCPQFTTYFKVSDNSEFVTCFNFKDFPYEAGGIQLQYLVDDELYSEKVLDVALLSIDGDTITWKHVYQVKGQTIENKLTAVSAKAWGSNLSGVALSIPNLDANKNSLVQNFNRYNVDEVVSGSGIGFGSNRVAKMELTGIRVSNDKGKTLYQDDTARVVFQTAP